MEELELIKLVIFDLDGTLVDSARQIICAVEQTRDELEFAHADSEFLKSKIGLPAKELFADLHLTESEITTAISVFRSHLRKLPLNQNDVFDGVQKLLKHLKLQGRQVAVATNKPTELAQLALHETKLLSLIDLVVGSENLHPKPDPASINKCLDNFQIISKQAVMIGDRCEDMLAAAKAGVSGIGVVQGSHTSVELKNAGAKEIFSNISDLHLRLSEGWGFENIQ